jgi:pyruvate formate lyase activating enzyme
MKEARYYVKTETGVQCTLCPHRCRMSEGRSGVCGGRICKKGKLYSQVYARPCSLAIDPVEKKPLLHFHPGMNVFSLACVGCNFRCLNCQNYEISQATPDNIPTKVVEPWQIIELCKQYDCKSIAYTYTEPLTYTEYVYDISKLAKKEGILNILVSDGYVNPEPLSDLCDVLDAANIDLKSFSDDIYRTLNGGTLQPVLDTLLTIKKRGLWLEITNLVIPGYTDDLDMIREMCKWLKDNGFENYPLHFSRFFPAYKLRNVQLTPLNTLLKAKEIAIKAGMNYVYVGNAPDYDGENTICPSCHKPLVLRNGFDIVENHVTEDGKCEFCGHDISGHWEKVI